MRKYINIIILLPVLPIVFVCIIFYILYMINKIGISEFIISGKEIETNIFVFMKSYKIRTLAYILAIYTWLYLILL